MRLTSDARSILGQSPIGMLDEPRLGHPADLLRPPPAIQSQHAFEREAEGDDLDVVAGADTARLLPHGLPPAHAVENLGHVAVIGEVVERALR